MYNKFITLGIETSCDETGISLYNNINGILSEYVYSQSIHKNYGGTVPELASRDHDKHLLFLLLYTLKKANITLSDINCISYTKGPGLHGPLLVGASFCKSLGTALSLPVIGVNHLEAHLIISFMFNIIKFPCLALIVSGAHTMMIKVNNYSDFIFIGETLDDGVGEVFDKVARSLKLEPFNGASIEKKSDENYMFTNLNFPKSFYRSSCFNFSFSGLKTHVLNFIINEKNVNIHSMKNISYNFQSTVIKCLLSKCRNVLRNYDIKSILLSGGVSSNKELRIECYNFSSSFGIEFYCSPKQFCMDNGSMVAFLGFIKFLRNEFDVDQSIDIYTRMYF